MGHYLSEMLDGSDIFTTKHLSLKKYKKRAKYFYKAAGHWKSEHTIYSITYHKMKGDDRKWYEIHCKASNGFLCFISVSKEKWDCYNPMTHNHNWILNK